MSKAVDFFRLVRGLPGGHKIFLRKEYDRLGRWLRMLARIHRRRLTHTRLVVVVGSLGKTTTMRALEAALNCPDRKVSYSNYGSSLAANLLNIRPGDRHAVLEVGINGPGRMAPNAKMIRPDVVVVTSIKSDHNRSFPTLEDTRAEKVKMVRALPATGIALLNGDDPHVRWMATQTQARIITFGLNPENDVRASDISASKGSTEFTVQVAGATHRVRSKLPGEHMLYPMLAAVAVAHAEKIDLTGAIIRLAQLPPTISRMELITLPDGTRLLDDSSKAPLESVHAAFATVAAMPARRKIVVLGNVEEPPGKQGDLYRDLGRRLAGFADFVICIGGDNLIGVRSGAVRAGMDRVAIKLAGSRIPKAIDLLNELLEPGDLVLIKGSSTQRLRRIVLALMRRKVSCGVKYCGVKVRACDTCPLLDAPESWLKNHFVSRYVEP
jgi:UDP-N-acetylmuramyl pentapeptide synthase